MHSRGWYTEKTHGSKYQSGWPDIYAMHPKFGTRWIETKLVGRSKLRPSQRAKFTIWAKHGVKIWVITSKDDYGKLLNDKCNWFKYV